MKLNLFNSYIFICLLFILHSSELYGNSIAASDSILSSGAEISLLTFERGSGVANIWGHTGIYIRDTKKNIDRVYNYGTYDFNAPNFLMKFLRGKLDYSLSHERFYVVERYYTYFKRSIFEQKLNLNYEEKVKLYELLTENYQTKNRYYKYDFFFDNCSTRPLYIIEKSISGNLSLKDDKNLQTFRQLLDWQIWDQRWLKFGIDLIIGSRADKIATPAQSSFLPLKLKEEFSTALIFSGGTTLNPGTAFSDRKLVKSESFITNFEVAHGNMPDILQPIWVFTILFLIEILIFYFSYKNGSLKFVWYDKIWFAIATIGGLIITFLWFFTDHIATKSNWNLLVFNPAYLFMLFRIKAFRYWVANFISFVLFMILLSYGFIPQELNYAVLPIAGTLLLKTAKYGLLRNYFIPSK